MSWSHQTNIGFSNGACFTYDGFGQCVARALPTPEFLRRLQLPHATTVLIATIQAGWRLTAGRPNLTPYALGLFPIPDFPVTGVFVNGGSVSLPTPPVWEAGGFHPPESAEFGYFDLLAGTTSTPLGGPTITSASRQVAVYYRPDTPGVVTPGNQNTYVAMLAVRVATVPKSFRSANWEPRLAAAPNLSLRIEPRFGGPVGQLGGGRLQLLNADGYFDWLEGAAWDAGTVTLEYGLDLPDSPMSEADYVTLGTWRVEKAERSDTHLHLDLKELKARIDAEIPFELFTRAAYPAIDNDLIGEPIPLAYGHVFGAPALVLDRAARTFKVALHPIRSLDAVRIKKQVATVETITVAAALWSLSQTSVYVTNFGDTVKLVTSDTTSLVQKNSVTEVAATAGTFYHEGDLLYVRLPAGHAINTHTLTVRREQTFDAWVASSFATTDLLNGQFTLGDDWDRSADVSVDFQGRVKPNGDLMENWADIVADLLDYLGETRFDAESFNTSRRELCIGADRFGFEAVALAPSLYLPERKAARDLFGEICETAGAALFVDPAGAWRFNVFRPRILADLGNPEAAPPLTFAHTDLLEPLVKIDDSKNVFSKILVTYARRHADGWAESIEQTRTLNRALHSINEDKPEEREPLLWRGDDATYFAQRLLTTEGPPLATYSATLHRGGLLLLPGDQIRLTHPRHGFTLALDATITGTTGMDQVLEVLSIDKDFLAGRAKCVLGDRRGWRDTFGWWLIENVTTPTLPNNAAFHLRAEGLAYTDQAPVGQWTNNAIVAPTGPHFIQPIAGNQPVFRENQINGLPTVRFAGFSGSFITHLFAASSRSPAVLFPNAQGEIFIIIKCDNDPGSAGSNGVWTVGTDFVNAQQLTASDGTIRENFGLAATVNAGNPAPAMTSWRLYSVSVEASAFTVRLDGAQIFTTAAHTIGFATNLSLRLGHGVPSPPSGFIGDVAEVLAYPRVLTTTERDAVYNYFATRFGLAVGTPGNLPLQWNRSWTAAQAFAARANYGWWHDAVWKVANLTGVDNDPRSFESSRWW